MKSHNRLPAHIHAPKKNNLLVFVISNSLYSTNLLFVISDSLYSTDDGVSEI